MAEVIETWFRQDLQEPVKVRYIDGSLFAYNGNGNRIGVELTNGGQYYVVTGTITGYVVLSDGTTVPCTGEKYGNRASILIPSAAYLPGSVFITLFATDGTTVTTIAALATTVVQTRTDSMIDPGSVITDWTTTINQAMQAVESAVADMGHLVATPYDSLTFPVPLGKYTYYNGNIYRCIVPISTSESFTPAHWSSAISLGDELSGLMVDSVKAMEVLGYAGSVITDANDAPPNSIYRVFTSEMQYYPLNMPPETPVYLLTIRGKARGFEQYFWFQYGLDKNFGVMYSRRRTGTSGPTSGTWQSWAMEYGDKLTCNVEALGYAAEVLADANDAFPNSVYRVFTNELNNFPINLPCLTTGWLLTTMNKAKGYEVYYYYQTLFDMNFNPIYTRSKLVNNGSGEWRAWASVQNIYKYLSLDAPNLLYVDKRTKGYYIDGSSGARGAVANYAYTIINVTPGEKYIVKPARHVAFFTAGADIGHSTAGYISGGSLGGEITVPSNSAYMTVSFPITTVENNGSWCGLASTYQEVSIGDKLTDAINNVVRVELDGSGDFTKLTDALAYGMEHKNTTIYLGPGTYDIISELGSDYFANFVYAAYTNMGPKIGNGTHLICSQKSKIVCNYTGNNQEVEMGFSPFNPSADNSPKGIGDYIIEGAIIEASRVRYIVHDDIGIQTIPYKHEYIRCKMYLDNSHNTHHTHAHSLGGGMGIDGVIVVKDCVFDGVSSDNAFVAWHNDNYTQQQMGYIDITGNYFKGTGTVQIRSIGTWPDKSPCLIHGNSLGNAVDYGISGGGTIDNFDMLVWNNEIRNG